MRFAADATAFGVQVEPQLAAAAPPPPGLGARCRRGIRHAVVVGGHMRHLAVTAPVDEPGVVEPLAAPAPVPAALLAGGVPTDSEVVHALAVPMGGTGVADTGCVPRVHKGSARGAMPPTLL